MSFQVEVLKLLGTIGGQFETDSLVGGGLCLDLLVFLVAW